MDELLNEMVQAGKASVEPMPIKYTLNCDKCGKPSESLFIRPEIQVCPKCVAADEWTNSAISDALIVAAHQLEESLEIANKSGAYWSQRALSAEAEIAELKKEQEDKHRHHIVCLTGSTRFTNEMMMATWTFAKQGIIALGWCVLPANHNEDGTEIDHHLIDIADEVFVLNVGGYIGEGTRREIAYAESIGKPVKYLEPI